MQNLELIEQKTLNYLRLSVNPVVPVEALLAHLREDGLLVDVSMPELLGFLSKHDLFRVFDIPRLENGEVHGRPAVVLDTRIPSSRDMLAYLFGELEKLEGALQEALRSARADGNLERMREVNELLDRLETIREQIKAQAISGK